MSTAGNCWARPKALIKGIEIPLPMGHQFQDNYGQVRNRVRVRWWDESAITYRSAAMPGGTQQVALPDAPIPEYARVERAAKPVFFGHYWFTGALELQSDRSACVDYSAGTGGALVAYRFDGEPDLAREHFVWVD